MMTLYLLLMNFFLLIEPKHCNTDGRSMWIFWGGGTTLKNKPHLVTFYESTLVRLQIFHPTLIQPRLILFAFKLYKQKYEFVSLKVSTYLIITSAIFGYQGVAILFLVTECQCCRVWL